MNTLQCSLHSKKTAKKAQPGLPAPFTVGKAGRGQQLRAGYRAKSYEKIKSQKKHKSCQKSIREIK